jgi:alpha-L-fucosidase 2
MILIVIFLNSSAGSRDIRSRPSWKGHTKATIQDAVKEKLYNRGEGKGQDMNVGWRKVCRSACWARLNETERAYFELRYAIDKNFAGNGSSMYKVLNTPSQIDADLGLGGAVLSMLVINMPLAFGDISSRTVVLEPAIPAA